MLTMRSLVMKLKKKKKKEGKKKLSNEVEITGWTNVFRALKRVIRMAKKEGTPLETVSPGFSYVEVHS